MITESIAEHRVGTYTTGDGDMLYSCLLDSHTQFLHQYVHDGIFQ